MCMHEISFYRRRHKSGKGYRWLSRVLPPFPTDEQRRLLNIGCGHDEYVRPVIESLGYQYVGLDHDPSSEPSVCGDAHRLPLGSDTIDAILAQDVFEHFHSPWVAIQELGRVAKEDALLVGHVPQLYPFHGDSYFNFTFLGIERLLEMGAFECVRIQPGESVGVHFLDAFLNPFPVTLFRKVLNGLFGAALALRHHVAKLYYNVYKGKLEESDSRRILYLLEKQDIIFAGGLKFVGRKNGLLVRRW